MGKWLAWITSIDGPGNDPKTSVPSGCGCTDDDWLRGAMAGSDLNNVNNLAAAIMAA